MRPLLESVDIDELVSNLHSEVEDIDRDLEKVKGFLNDKFSLEIAQGGVRGFSYCVHLYYGLENTFQPEDPDTFYGIPPGDVYRHLHDHSQASGKPLIALCADSLNRYLEPLNPSWHKGLEPGAVDLMNTVSKKIEALQKHTSTLPLNLLDEKALSAKAPGEVKKNNTMGL